MTLHRGQLHYFFASLLLWLMLFFVGGCVHAIEDLPQKHRPLMPQAPVLESAREYVIDGERGIWMDQADTANLLLWIDALCEWGEGK